MHKFIVRKRAWGGVYVARSCMGTRRGTRWGKWVTYGKYDTEEEALSEVWRLRRICGMDDVAAFWKGKRLTSTPKQ